MRIALVVSGGVDRSGRERVVPALLWLIEALTNRHEVHVFVLDYYPAPCTYRLLGATIHDLGKTRALPGARRFGIERRLEAALAAHGPFDVLHAYQGMPAGVVTAKAAARLRTPVVVSLDSGELVRHDDIEYGLQRRWIDRRAVANLLAGSSALTVSTNFMRDLAVGQGADPLVVPIGVAPSTFPLADRADGPPWRLIRVASINRVKDYPTLLTALLPLVTRLHDVHLDVVGEDTLDGAIKSMANELGIARHVTFHGVLPSDRVAQLYARAHVHVTSSRHEAAGVTVLEAACTGLATVGTAVGYVADWAPDLAVGVPIRDAGALSTAIADLLLDGPRRSAMAARARARAVEHDSTWTARRFEAIYDDVVRRH